MQEPELTLAASLRDLGARRSEDRQRALRSLAGAYLLEAGLASPSFRAAGRHALGPEVEAALRQRLADPDPSVCGLAAVGLGMLGDPEVVAEVAPWVEAPGDDAGDQFRRECAVIAISFVGAAAARADDGAAVRDAVVTRLRGFMHDARPDVRFQAAVALAEVEGDAAAVDLVAALQTEQHPQVRENLVDALSRIDPPPPAVVEAMADIVADPQARHDALAFEAAMILASARDRRAGPGLVDALLHRGRRDRALEALAVLGRAAPIDAVERVHALATALLTPGITRVRAAYALARIVAPSAGERINPGVALLAKLRFHPAKAVREAVADARRNLAGFDADA